MDKRFQTITGCFSVIGVIFTIMGAIVAILALVSPQRIVVVLHDILPPPTPIVVLITPTPLPPSLTEPTIAWTPTAMPTAIPTPRPTYTLVPTPTSAPYTEPGTMLEVGQAWQADGVKLVLNSVDLQPDYVDFYLRLYNDTPGDLLLLLMMDDKSQFLLKDNQGLVYDFFCDPNVFGICYREPKLERKVATREHLDFMVGFTKGGQSFADPRVTELLVTVNISRIQNAQWKVPVFH